MYLYLFENKTKLKTEKVRDLAWDYNLKMGLGLQEESIRTRKILKGKYGKPYFEELLDQKKVEQTIHFSISHSGNWWACLIGTQKMGLDIEDMQSKRFRGDSIAEDRARLGAIAKRFFTQKEYEYVLEEGIKGFTDIWVRKEAYLKFFGTGISQGLNAFSVIQEGKLIEKIEQVRVKPLVFGEGVLPWIHQAIKGAYCIEGDGKIEHIIIE